MNTYLLLFIVSSFSALLLTPLVRRACDRYGWLDEPLDDRRVHHKPVPRLGGIAIFAATLIALSTLPFIRNLLTQTLSESRSQLFTVLVPAACALLIGIYDDFRGTNARFKFISQGLIGLLFYLMGGRVEALSVPLVGTVALPAVLSCLITVFWTIAITNAFNLIDGMDGLATGTALFAALVLLAVSLMLGHPVVTVIAVALCGALCGFLPYNFNPASIFLGDSGSLFIGFTLAALSVQGAQKASTAVAVAIPIIAFGLPVLDTGFAIVRRFISGQPLFDGDREHIHHKLLERGWSQRRVVFVLYGICAVFGLLALFFVNDAGMRTTGLVLFVVGAAVLLIVGSLRYHEVDEVRASMRRGFSERRVRVANNIRVRRASRMMSRAKSLAEIFDAMEGLLEQGEFAYATVRINRVLDGAHDKEEALARERTSRVMNRAELRDGLINWTWERGDVEADESVGSGCFWSLQLPLSTKGREWGSLHLYRGLGDADLLLDINYLCDLFQREMSQAVERVMSAEAAAEADRELLALSAAGRN